MKLCINCLLKDGKTIHPECLTISDKKEKCEVCGETNYIADYNDEDYMTRAECNEQTMAHIEKVREFIKIITDELTLRGIQHDASKLTEPEVDDFRLNTKKLARLRFQNENGEVSDEYKESLAQLQHALDHHYAVNRHHPEHFPDGINGMDLIDLVELMCDWKAASLRQHDGNLLKSIEANCKRFGIDEQLAHILLNTAKYIDR